MLLFHVVGNRVEGALRDGDEPLVRAVVVDAGDDRVLADVLLADATLITLAAAANRSFDHAVADAELRHAVADFDHAPGVLVADDRREVHPLEGGFELVDSRVAPAEAGVVDLYEHLSGTRFRFLSLDELHSAGATLYFGKSSHESTCGTGR